MQSDSHCVNLIFNDRKRAKLSGEFHGILNKAKKGAAKGRKKQKRK